MKFFVAMLVALLRDAMITAATKEVAVSNPLQKVIELMSNLQGEVIADGEREQKTYREYVQWCKESAFERQHEIKDRIAKEDQLEAAIEKAGTDVEEFSSQIQDISGSLATDEADLKAVTLLREKENMDFTALDQELTTALDTLKRARRVLERELQNSNITRRSFLQKPTHGMQLVAATLNEFQELVAAASILSSDDRAKLTSLIQHSSSGSASMVDASGEDEEDLDLGAPAGSVYSSHSDNIIDQLADLEDKLYDSQQQARSKERTSRHGFEKMRQDLQGKIKAQNNELEDTKKDLAHTKEFEAESQKTLDNQKEMLKDSKADLEKLQRGCMQRATEYTEEVHTRKAEMQALAEAKKMVQDSSSNSFLQVNSRISSSSADARAFSFLQVDAKPGLPDFKQVGAAVVHQIRVLAKQTDSLALTQLASRSLAAIRIGISGSDKMKDPFGKVKQLIEGMMNRIQKEAQADLDHKNFCDSEMSKTVSSQETKEDVVNEASTRVDRIAAEVAKLEDELKDFYKEIAEITVSQAKLDKLRRNEHSNYLQTKKDLQAGLTGVQTALKILHDYYGNSDDMSGASLAQEDVGASMDEVEVGDQQQQQVQQHQHQQRGHSAVSGPNAGTGIIGLLEIVESDFAKILTETQSEEDAAEDEHRRYIQDSTEIRAVKEKLSQRATTEITQLKKSASEMSSDRSSSQDELDAINEYLARLKSQCIQKPGTLAQRIQKREVEIAGLKEALAALHVAK